MSELGSLSEELDVNISGPLLPSKADVRADFAFEPVAAIAAIRGTDVTEYLAPSTWFSPP
jgi:hypothetical protein